VVALGRLRAGPEAGERCRIGKMGGRLRSTETAVNMHIAAA
jgi:hypothetical protein